MRKLHRIGLFARERVAAHHQFEPRRQARLFEQRQGEARGLVGDAGEAQAHCPESLQSIEHARIKRGAPAGFLEIELLEQSQRLGLQRLGARWQTALHQLGNAFADETADFLPRACGQVQRGEHARGRSGEVWNGVEQRAVQIYHHGNDASRERHGGQLEALIVILAQFALPLTWGIYAPKVSIPLPRSRSTGEGKVPSGDKGPSLLVSEHR